MSTTDSPQVSLLMPLYNAAPFVREAVESILAQTFTDFELLVIDDGSTDGGPEVVAAICDPRVRMLTGAQQGGPAAARNRGLAEAVGSFIGFFDSDDVAASDMLAKSLEVMDVNPEVGLVGGWLQPINEAGSPTGNPEGYGDRPEKLSPTMLFRNCLPTSTLLVRREVIKDQRFDKTLTVASDFDLWARLTVATEARVLTQALGKYRAHPANITHRKGAALAECVGRIFCRQLARLGIEPTDNELQLHSQLNGLTFDTPKETVLAAERWLLKLADANALTQIYPQSAFGEVLADHWYHVCHSACGHGWWTWRRFHDSALARNLVPSLARHWELFRLTIRGTAKTMFIGREA